MKIREVVAMARLACRYPWAGALAAEVILGVIAAALKHGPGDPKGKVTTKAVTKLGQTVVVKACKRLNVPIYAGNKKGGVK